MLFLPLSLAWCACGLVQAFLTPTLSPPTTTTTIVSRQRLAPRGIVTMKKGGGGPPSKHKPIVVENEFSRLVSPAEITRKPFRMSIEAKQDECKALTERFELPMIKNLSANIALSRPSPGTIMAKGIVVAELELECGVTGDLFDYDFETKFKTYIKEVGDDGFGLDDDDEDVDESLYDDEVDADGMLDVGEIAAQYLYLDLPNYPCKPGVNLDDGPDEVSFKVPMR